MKSYNKIHSTCPTGKKLKDKHITKQTALKGRFIFHTLYDWQIDYNPEATVYQRRMEDSKFPSTTRAAAIF
jgi:hypothetical protein